MRKHEQDPNGLNNLANGTQQLSTFFLYSVNKSFHKVSLLCYCCSAKCWHRRYYGLALNVPKSSCGRLDPQYSHVQRWSLWGVADHKGSDLITVMDILSLRTLGRGLWHKSELSLCFQAATRWAILRHRPPAMIICSAQSDGLKQPWAESSETRSQN